MAKKATTVKATAKAKQPDGGGGAVRAVSDFLEFAWEWGTDEWVVLAVEAPIEQVTKAFVNLAEPEPDDVLERVPVRPATKKELGVASTLVPVVQVAGGAWTTIHRVVGLPIGTDDIEQGDELAGKLSAELKTRALRFVGEDTSGAMEVTVFDRGKRGASKEWDQELDVADAYFAKLGLTVPACYARDTGKERCLVTVSAEWAARIARADLADFGDE